MKHIIKVNNIQEAKDNPIRPIVALDDSGVLFAEGQKAEFVDLGLSVKWAKYNIGVNPNKLTKASDWYGNYYAWGEVETKSDYSWATYTRHTNGTYSDSNRKVFTKYIQTSNESMFWNGSGSADNLTTLEAVDDIATVTNSAWRMPTHEEFQELVNGTINAWETNYNGISGLNGYKFTSKTDSTKFIFIPAAGWYDGTVHRCSDGTEVDMWSSSLREEFNESAYNPYFNDSEIDPDSAADRCYGSSVRPVC